MRGRGAPCLLLLGGLLIWSGGAVGCATTRSVLDVRPATAVNPAHGPAVKLVRVTDRRSFQLKPPEPSIPLGASRPSPEKSSVYVRRPEPL